MMSSRKTMWTGRRMRGQPRSTGAREMPAMGTWTEMM